jgi:hypothetical protein
LFDGLAIRIAQAARRTHILRQRRRGKSKHAGKREAGKDGTTALHGQNAIGLELRQG